MGQTESSPQEFLVAPFEEDLPVAQIIAYANVSGQNESASVPSSTSDNESSISIQSLRVPCFQKHPIIDFDFKKKLYEGGWSTVYKAKSRFEGDERVAIKELNLHQMKDRHREAIQREMNILSQLVHPNIVQLHAVYVLPQMEKVFLITEYLRGGDLLSSLCQLSTYNENDVRRIFRQTAEAMQYIHDERVIHRDIKPLNIMLNGSDFRQSTVKIVDFGFAILEEPTKGNGKTVSPRSVQMINNSPINDPSFLQEPQGQLLCGTPGYIAPEVYSLREYSRQVDIWGLGCVLYLLLSGTLPFQTGKQGIKAVKNGKYSFPRERFHGVSSSAVDLIKHMLVVDPRERYTIHQVLNHSWLQVDMCEEQSPRHNLTGNLHYLQAHLSRSKRDPAGGNPVLQHLWQGWRKWQEPKELSRKMQEEHNLCESQKKIAEETQRRPLSSVEEGSEGKDFQGDLIEQSYRYSMKKKSAESVSVRKDTSSSRHSYNASVSARANKVDSFVAKQRATRRVSESGLEDVTRSNNAVAVIQNHHHMNLSATSSSSASSAVSFSLPKSHSNPFSF